MPYIKNNPTYFHFSPPPPPFFFCLRVIFMINVSLVHYKCFSAERNEKWFCKWECHEQGETLEFFPYFSHLPLFFVCLFGWFFPLCYLRFEISFSKKFWKFYSCQILFWSTMESESGLKILCSLTTHILYALWWWQCLFWIIRHLKLYKIKS